MNLLWAYFWPPFGAGLLLGGIGGIIAFRRRSKLLIAIGLAAALALAGLWHALGAAERFATSVERSARQTLDALEMGQVQAHLHHGPLSRRLVLSGPADDFQTSELVRLMSQLPGVSRAEWSNAAGVPLIVEGLAVALMGFLLGLLLAYLVELRRRYNAQWNW